MSGWYLNLNDTSVTCFYVDRKSKRVAPTCVTSDLINSSRSKVFEDPPELYDMQLLYPQCTHQSRTTLSELVQI
jgi:hypothetical protein